MSEKTAIPEIREIFHLFFKYPINLIPVVNKNEIKGYILKEKILKRANTGEYFNNSLVTHLESIVVSTNNHNDFFNQIENSSIKSIPAINANIFTISIFEKETFYNIYHPLDRLINDDLGFVLANINIPVLIVNSIMKIIYYNKKFSELKFFLNINDDIEFKPLDHYFPDTICKNLSSFDEKFDYLLEFENYRIRYRIQSMKLKFGTIYIIMFNSSKF